MNYSYLRLGALLALVLTLATASALPKREFRGAWIQCVNGQFQGMSAAAMQQTLTAQLDELQRCGANAIIFQVRGECDALYQSSLEPWSRFLTGQQGKAPGWDPLAWMTQACHKRGMEIHAWINPYRAKTKTTTQLAANHVAVKHPEWTFRYDNQLILNPALKACRDYTCKIVDDIVARYDIDGLHIDDYFYPYPAAGETIDDAREYRADPRGITNIADWRRDNVNLFIKQLSETIHERKPWVKFGVAPFGIYRNASTAPQTGSATRGLQNYDDLYADVLLWVNNGWVDYCVPQLYWQIGHPTADYKTLLSWWDRNASARPLFIGEDVERSAKFADTANPRSNQIQEKYRLRQLTHNVQGIVLWYAKAAVDNVGGYATVLKRIQWKYPALQPAMTFIDDKAPKAPAKLKDQWSADGYILSWTAKAAKHWQDETRSWVVYRFKKGEKINLEDPAHIVAITFEPRYKLPYANGKTKYTYVITALDRMSNESKGKKTKVKL